MSLGRLVLVRLQNFMCSIKEISLHWFCKVVVKVDGDKHASVSTGIATNFQVGNSVGIKIQHEIVGN